MKLFSKIATATDTKRWAWPGLVAAGAVGGLLFANVGEAYSCAKHPSDCEQPQPHTEQFATDSTSPPPDDNSSGDSLGWLDTNQSSQAAADMAIHRAWRQRIEAHSANLQSTQQPPIGDG